MHRLHGLLGAEGIEAVASVAEEGALHELEATGEQFVALVAEVAELNLALALQLGFREGRAQQHLGQEFEAEGEVLAQHFRRDAEAVVAAVGVQAAADAFDFRRELFGGAGLGALHHQLREHGTRAAVRRRLGQHAAAQAGAEVNEGQAMIFLHEQAQSVGQRELVDGGVRADLDARGALRRGALGQERVERAVLGREIFARDALEVGGFETAHGFEEAVGEVQVAGGEPVATEVRRLPSHRLARGEGAGGELFHGLHQLGFRHGLGFHLLDLG